ncbi:hypothetical protein StoSoilB5_17970 [Arthrobacter sp. StoSoilB5]|nr:hypothetical protein StoSoilB5_17970 [Arthrobacter sp. StoSoilB5]
MTPRATASPVQHQRSARQPTWNQANRLKSANGTSFTYDATGLRASRMPGAGPSQSYVWDTSRAVPVMLTDGALSYLDDAAASRVLKRMAGVEGNPHPPAPNYIQLNGIRSAPGWPFACPNPTR